MGNGQWNLAPLLNLLRKIVPSKDHFDNYEVTHDFPKIGSRTMLLNARKLYRPGNRTVLLVLTIEDITERTRPVTWWLRSSGIGGCSRRPTTAS